MRGISLNRAAIEAPNKSDLSAGATTNEMNCGLHIVRKGLLVVTLWLLLEPTHGFSQTDDTSINLLSKNNGGQVVVATNQGWFKTIDGNEKHAVEFSRDDLVVYAFKDEQPAVFDTFAVLIPWKGDNLKEFELMAGNDSPTGAFDSIGRFTTVNALVVKFPYQEFKFPPTTAKYLKLQIVSGWGTFGNSPIDVYQLKLLGRLKE